LAVRIHAAWVSLYSGAKATNDVVLKLGPQIEVEGQPTKVLVEQMGAVDVSRLSDLSGHLSAEESWGVDTAILTVLGLN